MISRLLIASFLKILSRYDKLLFFCGIWYYAPLHSRSLKSLRLGRLFPDNKTNCGLFLVFLFRLTSILKMFASYLFRHSHAEISPICHETTCTCVLKTNFLHLLVPLPLHHIQYPSNLIVSDPGHFPWFEDFA